MNNQEQNKLGAHLIKLYPWLKDEMETSVVLCVASKLLWKADWDVRKDIECCGKRRNAVDILLKLMLRKKCYIGRFFSILKEHWNPASLITDLMERNEPKDKEITGMFEMAVIPSIVIQYL